MTRMTNDDSRKMTTVRKWLAATRGSMRSLIVRMVFGAMERLLPIRRDVWCFCTWGTYYHTLDNPRAVFEAVKNDGSIRKVILQRGARSQGPLEGVNVHAVDAGSFRGMYWLSRSAVILVGYRISALCGYSAQLTDRHLIVQLWHGIPLKRIGRLFPGESGWEDETPLYAATVCSSEADRDVMQQAFAPLPIERVWLTGLPRNTTITADEMHLPIDFRRTLDSIRSRLGGRKLVLYAPTWRDADLSHYAFSSEEVAALELLLRAHDAVLGVRGHSNVRSNDAYTREYESDVFLNFNDIPEANLLLRVADVLVTDYSSIYIDYLLTDRPVVHFAYDLQEYLASRGLLYDPAEAFAGPPALTFADLLAGLEQALEDPSAHSGQRRRAARLFHGHSGNSAEAAAVLIQELATGAANWTQRNGAGQAPSLPSLASGS